MEQLKRIYLGLPPGLRARVPPGFEDWARLRLLPRLQRRARAQALEARLWGGFSRDARAGLAALADDPAAGRAERAEAALALMRWHGAAGEHGAALDRVRQARNCRPALARDRRAVLPEALLLCRLGRGAEARALIAAAGLDDAAARLARATSWGAAAGRAPADADRVLAEVNAVLARAGLAALRRRDPAAPPGLDNLATAPLPARGGALVTVIMALHDAGATVATALASLQAQSWADLEILVVDDASRDEGPDIVADLAARDPRIRLIRQAENLGAYAARNRALTEAKGEYVTVHDADDWSHPEKIARHADALVAGSAPFTLSDWARADDDLGFWGPWRPSPNLVAPNLSSAFFRRAMLAVTGPWDTARVSADREFIARAERLHGLAAQRAFLPGVPLAFGRSAEGSLTRGPFHAATLLHGIRREYREAAALWHQGLDPARIRAEGWRATPPFFPAPRAIRAAPGPELRHDLMFVADFNLRGGAFHSAFNMIRAGLAAGLDCAVLHYRRYDLDPVRPLDAGFRRFAAENGVRIVAPGERLGAKTVIVTYPAIFDHAMDRFPQVAHEHLGVVVNQMAERDIAGTDRAYDPARVRAHLAEAFGSEGIWIPNSGRVRALMAGDPRYPAPHPDIWMPLRDLATWCAGTPRWRGGDAGTQPVLGRHGRDHPLKWPPDPAMLRAAYCADRPCTVRFLGGARHARARLRRWPRNWSVDPFGGRDVQAFLADLDVFVHYPDPAYIEEFGGAAMEAMAVGVPAILAPELEPIYGPAALYADPEAIWPLVERLWRDRAFWEGRVAAGRDFVQENCGYGVFPGRLARLAAA